jgi:hypothetical protein
LHIDYNFLSTSNFILDAIEQNDEIIELISNKKENINYLVKLMNLMENENIEYDSNYIMITANLLIENKSIDKIIKREIDHDKIIQLIIKNETVMSYTYLFYIYAYLYFCDINKMEKLESLLDSVIWILLSKYTNNENNLPFEDVYDVLVIFSKVAKFSQKFYDNYNLIYKEYFNNFMKYLSLRNQKNENENKISLNNNLLNENDKENKKRKIIYEKISIKRDGNEYKYQKGPVKIQYVGGGNYYNQCHKAIIKNNSINNNKNYGIQNLFLNGNKQKNGPRIILPNKMFS